jgi:GT2 family glycosyltransferase
MIKNVDIIVVNWNSGALTCKAIAPYLNFKNEEIACKVIVVDNASQDNSVDLLQKYSIQLITNSANLGFGHACNQAFEQSVADYILLLNPDTESGPATLTALVKFLDQNEHYAVTGPRQVNEAGQTIRSCGRFPGFRTALYEVLSLSKLFPKIFTPTPIMIDWNHSESREVDHIMGSYMLIKKKVPDKTGFMDEDYFVYWEDIDLSRRISLAGHKSYFHADHTIFHQAGASGEKAASTRLFFSIHARRTYWKKHLGKPALYILTFLSLTVEPCLRLLRSLFTSPGDGGDIIKAYRDYVKELATGNSIAQITGNEQARRR